jgi:osmotically-inducible protein OsmY
MSKTLILFVAVGLLSAATVLQAPAQEGLGERIGEKIDRGLSQLKSELRQEWAQLKKSVDRMGVHGRVYSRLRWDKNVEGANIDIEVRDEGIVVLHGAVRNAAAKTKAAELAHDTVGVTEVVDELTVAPPSE